MTTWGIDQIGDLVRQNGGVILTTELIAAGVSKDVLPRLLRRRVLRRVCRGVYAAEAEWTLLDDHQQHLLQIRAQQRRDPTLVATGLSAAVVLGLPTPYGPPREPHLTRSRGIPHRGAVGGRGGAVQRRAWLSDDEITTVDGVLVTSPARTVIDCARHLDHGWSLAVGDAAAARWGVDGDQIITLVDDAMPASGHRRARWVARHLTDLGVAPLASLARSISILAALPAPTPHYLSDLGTVGLLDAENGVVVIVEPLIGAAPEDVWRDKSREDALREAGLEVCRFAMQDYVRPQRYRARLRKATVRGRRRRARWGRPVTHRWSGWSGWSG